MARQSLGMFLLQHNATQSSIAPDRVCGDTHIRIIRPTGGMGETVQYNTRHTIHTLLLGDAITTRVPSVLPPPPPASPSRILSSRAAQYSPRQATPVCSTPIPCHEDGRPKLGEHILVRFCAAANQACAFISTSGYPRARISRTFTARDRKRAEKAVRHAIRVSIRRHPHRPVRHHR